MAESSVLTPKGFLYLGTASGESKKLHIVSAELTDTNAAIGASLLIYDIFLTMDLEMDLKTMVGEQGLISNIPILLSDDRIVSIIHFSSVSFTEPPLFNSVNLVGFTTIVDPPEKQYHSGWMLCVAQTRGVSTSFVTSLSGLSSRFKVRFTTVVVFLVHVLALFCILIIDNVIGPGSREALAQVVPVGCNLYMYNRKSKAQDILLFIPVLAQFYYFTVTVVQFMKGAREVRSDPSFHLNSVFEINEMLPTFFLLLRQGAGYFVGTIFSYACILVLDFLSDPVQCLWLPAVMWVNSCSSPLLQANAYVQAMDDTHPVTGLSQNS
ncbi:hypothetical protein D9756_008507 [Leucocoprinus leucothites]|uniref:Uncharacterized protein n=1 Tax=Leucocoprinus leucothites TaxID=201217 RepID=A0A8H5CZ65_9AGAR|nr:hypothetical protein D9756_008507 [Leucoagaricus leucothites]